MFWKQFPKHMPKTEAWYQCTVEYGNNNERHRYVMDLYWYGGYRGTGAFIDNRRKSTVENYYVYANDPNMNFRNNDRLTVGDDKLLLIDRTHSVIAWKKLPRPHKSIRRVLCDLLITGKGII